MTRESTYVAPWRYSKRSGISSELSRTAASGEEDARVAESSSWSTGCSGASSVCSRNSPPASR